MRHLGTRIILVFAAALLAACATVADVQRASDLIRTDNELTRLLLEVRPSDPAGATLSLVSLANHAEHEASALKDAQKLDAIAYYRIAATAYWRSGDPNVASALFNSAQAGTELCTELGEKAPDRDCLFLRLVIPFAGLEAVANDNGLWSRIEEVTLADGASDEEIQTMSLIFESLSTAKPVVEKILAVGEDDRLLTHPGMREYYCTNARKAIGFYDPTAGIFVAKVKEFEAAFPEDASLGISLETARALREPQLAVPEFCAE